MDKQGNQGKQGKRRSVFIQGGTNYYVSADGKTFLDKDGYPVSKPVKAIITSSIASQAVDFIKNDNSKIEFIDKKEIEKLVMDILRRFYGADRATKILLTSIRVKIFAMQWRKISAARKIIGLISDTRVRFGKNTRKTFEKYDHKNTYTQAEAQSENISSVDTQVSVGNYVSAAQTYFGNNVPTLKRS